MPINGNKQQQQFQAVEDMLTRWLKERRGVLGRYTEIVVALDSQLNGSNLQKRQQGLCQLLVDYISAGHFEIFHELINEAESFDDRSCELAEKIMPAIGDTTEVILAYEEKYGQEGGEHDKLKRDLSALGEVLESRFVLEDRLIAGLHNRHRRQVENPAPQSI